MEKLETIRDEAPDHVEVYEALVSAEPEPLSESLGYLEIELDAGLTELFGSLEMVRRFSDRVWLHNQLDDPWLRPTALTARRYVECAYSVRGLRGWPLALLESDGAKEAISRVLPSCFPDAVGDPMLT